MNEQDTKAQAEYYTVCNEQGWNDYVQTIHLEAFIMSKGLMPEYLKYTREIQAEENA